MSWFSRFTRSGYDSGDAGSSPSQLAIKLTSAGSAGYLPGIEEALAPAASRRPDVIDATLREIAGQPSYLYRDGRGWSPLGDHGATMAAEAVLKAGAVVNSADAISGKTALQIAVEQDFFNLGLIRLLLANHADPTERDRSGRCALSIAIERRDGKHDRLGKRFREEARDLDAEVQVMVDELTRATPASRLQGFNLNPAQN